MVIMQCPYPHDVSMTITQGNAQSAFVSGPVSVSMMIMPRREIYNT